MTLRISVLLVGGLLLGGCGVPAPSPTTALATALPAPTGTVPPSLGDQLQQLADRIVNYHTPGVILGATRDGATFGATAGFAEVSASRAMASSDPFRIGSLTKTFTAVLALLLEEDGRLRRSDTVEDWLPGLVPHGSQISIQMLLSQTSGLFDYTEDPQVFGVYETDPGHVWQPVHLVQIATSHPALFSPGDHWAYSNTNYVVLGLILEKAGAEPLDRLFSERLLAPLGLADTQLATTAELPGTAAHGYLIDPEGLLTDTSAIDPSGAWSAGGIVSTAADVSRFYAALLGGEILDPASLDAMLQTIPAEDPLIHAYGLGIYEHNVDCGVVWGHDGEIFGYQTFAYASRSGDRTLVAMVNRPDNPWWLERAANLVFCGEGH